MIKINQLKHRGIPKRYAGIKSDCIPSAFHYVGERRLDVENGILCILHLCNDPSGKQHRKKLHQPSVSLVTETGYRFSEMGWLNPSGEETVL